MKYILLFIAGFLLFSCSPHIRRIGYSIPDLDYRFCDKVIKKKYNGQDSSFKKIGEIRIWKLWRFGKMYSEAEAIQKITNEACKLNADFINVTRENDISFFCNAYRCRAEFYKISKVDTTLKSDDIYSTTELYKRVALEKRRDGNFIKASVIVSLLAILFGGLAANS